ncbi:MAG TPA: SipW-dependent-type signal peptide-containing protein [Clostridia bacterium]|nr:SipW-dependent-type signal peptide-containing protein [Clostridia bacterium]
MKKKILVISLTVSLIAIAALGATLAYFTDNKTVTNTFTMGNVKIELKEITGYGEDNEPVYGVPNDNSEVDFGTVLPGSEKIKAPFVKNIGDNDAYVQLKVTIDNSAAFDKLFKDYNAVHSTAPLTIFDFFPGAPGMGWTGGNNVESGDTRTYIFQYDTKLAKNEQTSPIFKRVVIPTFLDDEFADANISAFTIGITAQAIQADNFVDADAAFAELNK